MTVHLEFIICFRWRPKYGSSPRAPSSFAQVLHQDLPRSICPIKAFIHPTCLLLLCKTFSQSRCIWPPLQGIVQPRAAWFGFHIKGVLFSSTMYSTVCKTWKKTEISVLWTTYVHRNTICLGVFITIKIFYLFNGAQTYPDWLGHEAGGILHNQARSQG